MICFDGIGELMSGGIMILKKTILSDIFSDITYIQLETKFIAYGEVNHGY